MSDPLASAAARADDAAREAASTDFGGIVRRLPAEVVAARSADDVRRTLESARRAGRSVVARGAGHSQAGQSLTDGGIALDMTRLDRIGEPKGGAVRVQAGATWREIVRRAGGRGLRPPVLTTNLDATVGGTLSMGGFGASSHRRGTQADNVDELVVVTGDGREARCSRNENPELFDCVRCGLGQFAVIVEARLRLRPAKPAARSFHLAYEDLDALMRDQRRAMLDNRFEWISSLCLPRAAQLTGLERLLARGSPFARRRYAMSLTTESDEAADAALEGLRGGRLIGVEDGPAPSSLPDLDRAGAERPEDRGLAHPWIEGILPWRTAGRCIEEILDRLPAALPLRTTVLLWAAPRGRFGAPMLALPNDDFLMGFGLQPAVPPASLARLLPSLEAAGDTLTAHGGKRYLSGWVDYDHDRWRAHFGALWPRLIEWKEAFDPHRLFDPGFLRYAPERPASTAPREEGR